MIWMKQKLNQFFSPIYAIPLRAGQVFYVFRRSMNFTFLTGIDV